MYESLEWTFLEQIIVEQKFPDLVIKWIMQCVTTVNYSIMVNGKDTRPFYVKRGIRHRDPLHTKRFVLVMDYLIRILKTLHNNIEFHYHPRYAA